MYALFDTINMVMAKLDEIEATYPNEQGDEYYAIRPPRMDINGKYYLSIHPDYADYFAGCVVVQYVIPKVTDETI